MGRANGEADRGGLRSESVGAAAALAAVPLVSPLVDNLEEVDQPLFGHLEAVHDLRALDVLDIALEQARKLLGHDGQLQTE